jgi:SdpC family antimicrobial peptide
VRAGVLGKSLLAAILLVTLTVLPQKQDQHNVAAATPYGGQKLFEGLFFGIGPVADLFPEWTVHFAGIKSDPEFLLVLWQVEEAIVAEDPDFYKRLKIGLQSGDHLRVRDTLNYAGSMLLKKLKSSYNATTFHTSDPGVQMPNEGGGGAVGGGTDEDAARHVAVVRDFVLAGEVAVAAAVVLVLVAVAAAVIFWAGQDSSQEAELQREEVTNMIVERLPRYSSTETLSAQVNFSSTYLTASGGYAYSSLDPTSEGGWTRLSDGSWYKKIYFEGVPLNLQVWYDPGKVPDRPYKWQVTR